MTSHADERDVSHRAPATHRSADTMRTWSALLVPPLLAVASVVVTLVRTWRSLAEVLVDGLSPASLIASEHNSLLDHLGFPTGGELLSVSLPLRLYSVLGALGAGPGGATMVMVALEVVFLFVAIAWSVRIIQPSAPRELAAVAATVGTLGHQIDGNNLANFGFFYGWNYGFAYGIACVAIAYALRRRWTAVAIAGAALVTVHSVVAVLVALAIVPLAALDLKRREFEIRLGPAVLALAIGGAYLWFGRGDVSLGSAHLDTAAYIARLRAFQSHLFFEFDPQFLRRFAEDIGAWSIAVVVTLGAALTARRLGHQALASRVAIIIVTVTGLSMLGWAHSNLAAPNVTLLLMEIHRSSVFVNLLLLTFALPLVLGETRRSRRLALPLCLVVWCSVYDVYLHLAFGLLTLVVAVLWIVAELRQHRDRPRLVLAGLAGLFAVPATYFTLSSIDFRGGWDVLLQTITARPGTLIAIGVIVAAALVELVGVPRLPARSGAVAVTLAAVLAVLVLGSSTLANPVAASGSAAQLRSDLVDVATWARDNTPDDAVFLMPFDDYGFGWSSLSERATVGKPRGWLHYAFLYSRDQAVLADGTRRANLLGVDVDDWLRDHPQLGAGDQLVSELSARFNQLDDRAVVQLGDQLDADYYVFDRAQGRDLAPCFQVVYENLSFQVAVPTAECRS